MTGAIVSSRVRPFAGKRSESYVSHAEGLSAAVNVVRSTASLTQYPKLSPCATPQCGSVASVSPVQLYRNCDSGHCRQFLCRG